MATYRQLSRPDHDVVTREWLAQYLENLEAIHDAVSVASNAVGVGTGEASLKSLALGQGGLVSAIEGAIEALTPPSSGVYHLEVADDELKWVAHDVVHARGIYAATSVFR